MENTIINAEALEYSYGKNKAVKGISFRLEKGKILGFLGPNGAGKSTTIKMLTGQIHPTKGSVFIFGKDVAKNARKVREQIGVAFEQTNLYEQLTAKENLVLFAKLFNIKHFDAEALLKRVDLADRGNDKVAGFSKGMKQRLMIARSLVNMPKVLFLDEPTDGLDPVSAENIRKIILEECRRGAAVFLTTHDMNEADKLADNVAFLNSGEIVAIDTPRNLKQKYGKRVIRVETEFGDGTLNEKEIVMDKPDTFKVIQEISESGSIVTIHSREATLEDIFIKITGRGLTG